MEPPRPACVMDDRTGIADERSWKAAPAAVSMVAAVPRAPARLPTTMRTHTFASTLLLSLSLSAAACAGGNEDDSSSSSDTTAEAESSSSSSTPADSTSTGVDPSTSESTAATDTAATETDSADTTEGTTGEPIDAHWGALVRGSLFTADLDMAQATHDAIAMGGEPAATAAGDYGHDVLLGTTLLGTTEDEFLAIDQWDGLEGAQIGRAHV